MHHCVATFTESVQRGRVLVFSVVYVTERLTVAVEIFADGLIALTEIAGFSNAAPSPAARRAVEAWLERQRVVGER